MKLPRLFPSLLMLALAALSANPCGAQQEDIPTPKPPYVAPLPKFGHWAVTLKFIEPETHGLQSQSAQPQAAPHDESLPITIDTVKTDNTQRVTLSFKNGTTKQINQVGGYFLMSSTTGLQISTFVPDSPPYQFFTDGFLFVEFIGPETFKGLANILDA
jgi:hypothetical protein